MSDQYQLFAATRRGALVLLFVCLLFTVPAWAGTISNVPVVTGVSATISGTSTLITINGTAPMAYTVLRPDARTILIELPGVDATRLSRAYHVTSPLVAAMTLERGSNPKPVPRLRISLRAPVRDRSQMADNRLTLELSPEVKLNPVPPPALAKARVEIASLGVPPPGAVKEAIARETPVKSPSPDPTPTPLPSRLVPTGPSMTITPTTQNNVAQSEQGQRYGQPGFVGEPINLNVVNADIRDILNYITEQYGVNFVIDSSVGAVPVTVNVTDVPWNVALDAILRANRLGVDVNGNILRVATIEVLATEAASQQKIKDAQLDNSQLVTEFIRLNYARASGTLAQAAGSTGAFAGGSTNLSFSGGAGGDATGGGGDQGLLPIISRRLSRRGSIEVDGRSNTLIITDVKENIDAIRQLVTILDQPEPQVEIETRIVIASRNFSRDLGVQLSAIGFSLGRDAMGNRVPNGGGSLATLPNATSTTAGPQPFGVPNGLAGTPQPTNSLSAANASTVIGLTTGLLGTMQISALITAAETKGQAKVVATPRVTVLNNRPAQIESGQQIPVQTTQAAGGTAVVTTTFVSVPLRLSITPQITDVGTVVLRVTAENNSISQNLAVGGVPGIDTQRMQSEVLVPDGGTTVMGGVLADSESEAQQRTPGLGSIPIIGNLFKRRLTTRTTNELLFFITPRIYRPDFQGRPTAGTISTGTRTTTIPQPVPLGNPPTNTPTPTQLQQQQQQPVTPNPQNPGQQTPGQQLLNAPIPSTPAGTQQSPTARPSALGGQRP
ncbi:MAG TPA: type IV pilus secretin PilQ [Pyrinomonadaceae bacterium]|jgi:type IV pilus assembly protein PilQ